MEKKIGQLIKEEVKRQGLTPNQFAGLICKSRQNLYDMYKRDNFDMELLMRISKVLHRNFFAELYQDMASKLGAAEPPATWANMKLQSLTHPLRGELGMKVFSTSEWTKEREELKGVLKEYFESDYRMPLLILESGYTFGAREVVKQVAEEVFRSCGAAPCPKLIDISKVKVMPEKVLIDYIDKNTFDSLNESDRRLNELCQIQKEVTKKFVCVIHTDPTPFTRGANEKKYFDLWGGEEHKMLTRYEQCFITVYRWGRRSLLSWAKDTGQHEYVVNFIKNHRIADGSTVDYQLSHNYVSINQMFLGLPPKYMKVDYPTVHAYNQDEWEYASEFFSEQRDIKEEWLLRDFIEDIKDFNEKSAEDYKNDEEKKNEKYVKLEIGIEVEGNRFDNEKVYLPERVVNVLRYLYHQAWETDLKGLDEYDDWEEFDKWLKQHHPELVKELTEAAEDHMIEQLDFDMDGNYRNYIPCEDLGDCWGIMPNLEYKFDLYGFPKWE